MFNSLRMGWWPSIFVSVQGVPRKGRGRAAHRRGLEQCEDRVLLAMLPLGAAETFAILAGSTVTNTGSSTIVGDLGVSPGNAVTGFPPGLVTGGTIHAGDAVALQAQNDLTTAYNVIAGEASQADLTGQDLGGMTLTPGVYHFSSSAQLTGTLTLDAQGDPEARFDFQIGSTLTTAGASSVLLINGADGCNVNWQIGSSATLGTNSTFEGNILALTSITLTTGANIGSGRALARNGAVTLDTNNVSNFCLMDVIPPVEPPVTPPVNPPVEAPGGTPPGGTTPGTPPGTPPTADSPPLMIVRRFGFHAQPTILVLSFSTPLDAARAQDVNNYRLVTLGGAGRDGSRVGRPIGVLSAVYDPSALTVTLRPAERLDVHNAYRLTVKGTAPDGLAGPSGVPLGRDFVGLISRSTLEGPAPTPLHGGLRRRAQRSPVGERVSAGGVDAVSASGRWADGIRLARRQAAGR